jgi:hypothetical protein
VTVDLGAVEHGAVSTHPKWLGVRIQLQRPRDNGLAGAEEAPALNALHDRLDRELVIAADGLFVVRFVTDGCLFLGYYVLAVPDRLPGLTDAYEPYHPTPFIRDDPEWSILFDNFAPDEFQTQLIRNARVLQQLQSRGDSPRAKRKVDHVIVLPAGPVPAGLLDRLRRSDYAIDGVHERGDETVLSFSREDDLTNDIELTSGPFDLAKEFGGRYDGWGAPITQ